MNYIIIELYKQILLSHHIRVRELKLIVQPVERMTVSHHVAGSSPAQRAIAGVAQLAEQLICNQQVKGSIPSVSSICRSSIIG